VSLTVGNDEVLEQASNGGIHRAWLQVVAENHAARALYDRAGFTNASSYHYRTQPCR